MTIQNTNYKIACKMWQIYTKYKHVKKFQLTFPTYTERASISPFGSPVKDDAKSKKYNAMK